MKKYLIEFNAHNVQKNYVENNPSHLELMRKMGKDVNKWLDAPEDFNPKKHLCILKNGVAKIDTVNDISTQQSLESAKAEALIDILKQYNLSRSVEINNGKSLAIFADTPERKHFLKNIEESRIFGSSKSQDKYLKVYEYRQHVDATIYAVRAVAYLWNAVFAEYYEVRVKQRLAYDAWRLAIKQATSIKVLNNIKYKFLQPFEIDVNEKIKEIETDAATPAAVREKINTAKDEQGVVHLVKNLMA